MRTFGHIGDRGLEFVLATDVLPTSNTTFVASGRAEMSVKERTFDAVQLKLDEGDPPGQG